MVSGYVQSQRINEHGRALWLKPNVNPRGVGRAAAA
jgi:hypothetical protein